jgi:signal peptidase I
MNDPSVGAPKTASEDPAATEAEILHGADRFAPDVAAGAPPPAPMEPQKSIDRRKQRESLPALLQSLVSTVVIALFVVTFVTQAFQIPTESMQDTLLVGDYLLVDKVHYAQGGLWERLLPYAPIRRGDIVVFKYPVDPSKNFVKRVIGVPNDHVRLKNGEVWVNGRQAREPYVVRNGTYDDYRDNFPVVAPSGLNGVVPEWRNFLAAHVQNGELVVPKNSYFVMGDNRDNSSDSRYWGLVPRENIVGRPWLIYLSLSSRHEPGTPGTDDKLGGWGYTVLHFWEYVRWDRTMRLVK